MRKFVILALMTGAALATPAGAASPGVASGAMAAYMKGTKVPCYTQAGEARCTIASLSQGMKVFYGKPDASTEQAVAFVTYQYDATGNAMDQMAIVFRKEGEQWVPVGRADNTVGTSPRDVRFSPGAITYTGTVVGQNDSRVAPTGKSNFRLLVAASGVTFAGKGNVGTSMQSEIERRR